MKQDLKFYKIVAKTVNTNGPAPPAPKREGMELSVCITPFMVGITEQFKKAQVAVLLGREPS